MRRAVLGLCLWMGACTALPTEAPPLPDSTMVEILAELHLWEARAEITGDSLAARDALLARYGVDPETYEATLTYYAEHPEEYLDLYNDVLDALRAERDPLGTNPEPPDTSLIRALPGRDVPLDDAVKADRKGSSG